MSVPRQFRLMIGGSLVATVWFIATSMLTQAQPTDAAQQYVRESRALNVRGARELWQLVWEGKPATVCGPDEVPLAITCPCTGFAYGEYGNLALVRRRNGREVERMQLAPLFGMSDYPEAERVRGKAILQRWPLFVDDLSSADRSDPKLLQDIRRRRQPTTIQLADYDRDGLATEFLIQVGTLPCGKLQFAAVGISVKEPHLHALASATNPNAPLIMPRTAWDVLLKGPGTTAVTTWPCGDHGSDVRSELVVSATNGDIRVKARDHSCPADGTDEKLIKETDL